jgi:putative oxidoreductase
MRRLGDPIALLGRLFLGALFVWGGATQLLTPGPTQAMIARLGVEAIHLAYFGGITLQLGAGLALALGWRTRLAAWLLVFWCLATAWFAHFHPANPGEITQMLKNLGLAGGLLQFTLHGPGRFSVDRR